MTTAAAAAASPIRIAGRLQDELSPKANQMNRDEAPPRIRLFSRLD